jgi:hypothetical protein
MSNIQVKNVPEPLHRRLRRQAKRRGCTMSEIILRAVEAELARTEWRAHLEQRPRTRRLRGAAARAGTTTPRWRTLTRYVVDASAGFEYLLRTPLGCQIAPLLEDATLLTADGALIRTPQLGIVVHNVRL